MTASSGTMQLNRAFVFLCLVISVGAQRNHRLTCYLDALTHRTREGLCTHIIVPSISSDEDLHLQSLSEDDRIILGKMKERNQSLKILLGLEVRSSRLELISANEGSVENFIQTVLTYLKDNGLDGLDVTWLDDPASDVSTGSKDLFTNFLKSLKGRFEGETDPPLLSVSVLEPTDQSAVSYDERTLSQYVDFISILPAHLEQDGPYINKTVQQWQDQHVDLQKLNLVMPGFLRRSRRRHHHRHHSMHDGMNSEEGKKDRIHVLGLHMGVQVCQAIKSGQEQFITLTVLSEERSLVLQKGFGGIGVVFIDLDVFFKSICADITQDKRAIVESKVIMLSHHGRDDHHHSHHHHNRSSHLPHSHHGHDDHHHSHHHHNRSSHLPHSHHGRDDHHQSHHHHRSSHLPHGSHNIGHHHRRHHHHGHGQHHHGHRHHHHHPQPHPIFPQSNMTREEWHGAE